MKRLLEMPEYVEEVKFVASLDLPWEKLRGKTILITGGTGQIGSFLVDVLNAAKVDCKILLLGRSEEKANNRFAEYLNSGWMKFVRWDASAPSLPNIEGAVDYLLHLASNTHPVAYATDPVSTIVMNVSAAKELLDLAVDKKSIRFVYASSVEIYGQNRGDSEKFSEDYCGYIDCNTLRAGYPESKRCGEALCQAYIKQYDLDIVIPRIARVYGPTLLKTDTKALSQFLANALAGQDIVLKSEGRQYFSYLHVADAVSGILTVMMCGKKGEAYNLSDERSDIRLRDLAKLIAGQCGRNVLFELPKSDEAAGFSPAMLARMEGSKARHLGWRPRYNIEDGIRNTIGELKRMA